MKQYTAIIVMALAVSSILFGQTVVNGKNLSVKEISNLNNCIASENTGVKEWGIYLAGKHKVEESVETLTEAYKSTSSVSLKKRVLFSLYQINTEKSRTAISDITIHEESVPLKRLCMAMNSIPGDNYTAGL